MRSAMSAIASATPADLTITPRNRAFGRDTTNARWWCGGDPVATAFYNALSMTFPKGEAFFIESVRHYRDLAAEPLAGQIADFIKQEAIHSREHVHFNRQVRAAGYDLAPLEAAFAVQFAEIEGRPPLAKLTATLALEHFTAILAAAWLKDPRHFAGAPEEIAKLWGWHAMEEIEHKGVAYDTFLAATAAMPARRRYGLRCLIMLRVTRRFLTARLRDMGMLFRQDGIDTFGTRLKTARFLLIYPGVLRQIFPTWLSFFRPGFHPWNHDDRALLRAAEARLGPAEAG